MNCCSIILDPSLRTLAIIPFQPNCQGEDHVSSIVQALQAQPTLADFGTLAPVLIVPRVFELAVCRKLIRLYDQAGGRESGFMLDVEGKTVEILDPSFKRRADFEIQDPELIRSLQARLIRRLVPEIQKAFQFQSTRIERHIVACYEGE